jgi:hypothetical protein
MVAMSTYLFFGVTHFHHHIQPALVRVFAPLNSIPLYCIVPLRN